MKTPVYLTSAVLLSFSSLVVAAEPPTVRPNVLYVISDDQSWPHAGAYGYAAARTPAFDRIAREGVLFNQAFAPTPGCSPTRAAVLTGRNNWQIEQAGTHWSTFPRKYEVFPDRLEAAGYFIGKAYKGWAPGNLDGWERNPAGPRFGARNWGDRDYVGAFAEFLEARPEGKPFLFWLGALEPHPSVMRANRGIGIESGYDLDEIVVPPFLPDVPEVRSQMADYLRLIEMYDQQLGQIIDMLEASGELENTLVIVTSDHGMGFPRAKANLYEYSLRVPLAIRWGASVPAGRVVDDLVNLIDLTATIYEVAGVEPPQKYPITGRCVLGLLQSGDEGIVEPDRDAVFFGRERHTSARYDNAGYPMRSIRTHDYLYIRNFAPDRWPAGAPRALDRDGQLRPVSDLRGAFADIDPGPSMVFLLENRDQTRFEPYFLRAVGKRPAEELYDINADPGCQVNLAQDPDYAEVRAQLAARLNAYLRETGDPRVVGPEYQIFESYPRYGSLRRYLPPEEEPDEWRELQVPPATGVAQ